MGQTFFIALLAGIFLPSLTSKLFTKQGLITALLVCLAFPALDYINSGLKSKSSFDNPSEFLDVAINAWKTGLTGLVIGLALGAIGRLFFKKGSGSSSGENGGGDAKSKGH